MGEARRADARANYSAILAAAAKLECDHALNLPYDEIALAAGVGRATVYRHFPRPELLERALLQAALIRWEAALVTLAPGAARLEQLFDVWVHLQLDWPQRVQLLGRGPRSDALRRARLRFENGLKEPVRESQDAGKTPAHLSARDVRIILTMLSSVLGSSESVGDQRRAIELARDLMFD